MEGRVFEFISKEDFLELAGDYDCCYCSSSVSATNHHLSIKHLRFAVHFKDSGTSKFTIPCHCPDRKFGVRSHWHCPKCAKIINRSGDFKSHLKNHGMMVTTTRSDVEHPSVPTIEPDQVQQGTRVCHICGVHFRTTSNLRRHEKEQHDGQEPMLCIDAKNGLYVTTKYSHGIRLPIHVQKCIPERLYDCEVDECRDFMSIAAQSGNPGKECYHLERTRKAHAYIPPAALKNESVNEMVEKGLISTCRQEECMTVYQRANSEEVDCVFPIFWGEHSLSDRYVFFSVYTGEKDSWSKFGRTLSTFDTKTGKWHCQCIGSKNRISCVHRYLSMWWLFQEHPHLAKNAVDTSNEDIEDIEEMVSGNLGMPYQPEYTHSSLITMTNYLWNFKRIPEDLPPDLTKTEKPVPENFEPTEKNCPYCPGPCPPELNNAFVLTTKATVYGIFSQNKGISVYVKECSVCRNIVRFQEYNAGFHNYNNRVFLSIPLCSFLTTGLSNHIAIGRMLRTIESHSGTKVPYNTLRKAFYHFSALRKYSYNYFCYRCGHHPSVVIADTNWKVAFELPVHLLKRPEKHNITPQETEVNVAARWENLEKEIVATGLCEDASGNPFRSALSYSAFAPWMGQHTRNSDTLPKTEVFKGLSYSDRASTSRVAKEIDEDHILQVLDSKSPKKDELTKACNVLGVSASGSIADMINRLEELLLYKHVYPKMFVKLKKAGGGVLHMGCTHGVVYYASPLWWQESARDHGDALLSFKHPPTVYICDIAGRVARHVNNRTHQQFFQPHDGRVCEPTEANISLASAGRLRVNLDWVDNIKKKTRLNLEHSTTEQFSQPHPETGTSDRFSFYDRFHQKNQKRPEEKLRSLKAIPELASLINTAEAEQVNRELSSSRYSLCQMKDTHYMFSIRLYFHLHNARKNSAFLKEMQKRTDENIRLGLHGKLVCGQKETITQPTEHQGRDPHVPAKVDSVPEEGKKFSVAMFPIDQRHKETISKLYSVRRNDNEVIARISSYAILYLRDLKSVLPPHLLSDTSSIAMPWLTDNAVNCRVAQIAEETKDVMALNTDTFILWHRDWQRKATVSDVHLKVLENDSEIQKILLPRIVGSRDDPERGCHFILWVFDMTKHIRVYDNTSQYLTIHNRDMEILKDAFRNIASLDDWTVSSPQQWQRDDGRNCGVFVCTMAEMEAKSIQMCQEILHTEQMGYLRLYHASCMVKHLQPEDFPPEVKIVQSATQTSCMAQDVGVCIYQKYRSKVMHPQIQSLDWIQCDLCKKWLHSDCAGISLETITEETSFSCGCDTNHVHTFEKTLALLKKGWLVDLVIQDQEVLRLHEGLRNGTIRSSRMFLFKHPTFSPKLRMKLSNKFCFFDEEQLTLLMLQKTEGFHRFQAEMALQSNIALEVKSSNPPWF